MTDPRRLACMLPIVVGAAFAPALLAWEAPPEASQGRAVAVELAAPGWSGVASCSAFACHGGGGPDGDHRGAYATWMARDPHSRAGSVLLEAVSADIEAKL